MKLTLAIKKHTAKSTGYCQSHNTRLDTPKSQIEEKEAWFGGKAASSSEWREDRLEKARALAKRKDAVVALELVVQVGNQADWRELPTPEHPYGKPKKPPPIELQKMALAIGEAVKAEFGKDNLVNASIHLDESTPHMHLVVTPIHDGKLNQKHWIGGYTAITSLRERLHERIVDGGIACEYTPGGPGGEPHEADLGAGAPAMAKLAAQRDLAERKAQNLFSQVKKLELENFKLKATLDRHGIKPEPEPEKPKPKPTPSRGMDR